MCEYFLYGIMKCIVTGGAGFIGSSLTKKVLENGNRKVEFEYKGTADFDKAQVTIGGIDVTEVSNKTLESKKVENLYIAGELLDIDGDCGGFNLHWAFASGVAVAKDLVKKIRDFEDD